MRLVRSCCKTFGARNLSNLCMYVSIVDINSRHPVILGLRNILKTACLHDVTTITIPALLTHEITEV